MATIAGWRIVPAAGMLMAAWLATASVAAAQAIPGESLVTQQRDLLDCEFSQARGKIAWVDINGGL
ncbi:MAG: hypothetical protein QM719_02935 [Thermomonas sp.]